MQKRVIAFLHACTREELIAIYNLCLASCTYHDTSPMHDLQTILTHIEDECATCQAIVTPEDV